MSKPSPNEEEGPQLDDSQNKVRWWYGQKEVLIKGRREMVCQKQWQSGGQSSAASEPMGYASNRREHFTQSLHETSVGRHEEGTQLEES